VLKQNYVNKILKKIIEGKMVFVILKKQALILQSLILGGGGKYRLNRMLTFYPCTVLDALHFMDRFSHVTHYFR
jgi:hypothetical protein